MLSTTAGMDVSSVFPVTRGVTRLGAFVAVNRASSQSSKTFQNLSPALQNFLKKMLFARAYGISQDRLCMLYTIGLLELSSGSTKPDSATQTLGGLGPIGTAQRHGLLYQSAATHR
jgi:hypothetical protein